MPSTIGAQGNPVGHRCRAKSTTRTLPGMARRKVPEDLIEDCEPGAVGRVRVLTYRLDVSCGVVRMTNSRPGAVVDSFNRSRRRRSVARCSGLPNVATRSPTWTHFEPRGRSTVSDGAVDPTDGVLGRDRAGGADERAGHDHGESDRNQDPGLHAARPPPADRCLDEVVRRGRDCKCGQHAGDVEGVAGEAGPVLRDEHDERPVPQGDAVRDSMTSAVASANTTLPP